MIWSMKSRLLVSPTTCQKRERWRYVPFIASYHLYKETDVLMQRYKDTESTALTSKAAYLQSSHFPGRWSWKIAYKEETEKG